VLLDEARRNEPRADLNGSIVLIGITAQSFQDYHHTPFTNQYMRWFPARTSRMAGTELQANVLATIADGAYIRSPLHALPVLLAHGAVLGLLLARASLLGVIGITLAHHFLWRGAAQVAFSWLGWRLPIVNVLGLGGLLLVGTLVLRWRQIWILLALFKSEGIANILVGDQEQGERRAAEKRTLTVLFADIRGFTPFSEGRDPREVVELLNTYFDVIVPVIERHGGTLNQYIGDGIMVLFGAPQDQPDHARRAVEAAVEVVREVRRNRERFAALGFAGLRVGVGINTGEAVVGSVGSRSRIDYTAIGDTTNTAARIEALNKEFGTQVLISKATRDALGDVAAALGCEPGERTARVKNKTVTVFAVGVP
jgi:adenylate cyclase